MTIETANVVVYFNGEAMHHKHVTLRDLAAMLDKARALGKASDPTKGDLLDTLKKERDEARRLFGELAARIDRDGGQKQEGESLQQTFDRVNTRLAAETEALELARKRHDEASAECEQLKKGVSVLKGHLDLVQAERASSLDECQRLQKERDELRHQLTTIKNQASSALGKGSGDP
jgi:chromosome segregation ATPase